MEFRDYLRIARQRWLLIAVSTLAAVAVAVLFTISATPQYQSTARLFVSTQQSDSTDAYTGGLFSQERVKSYASLVTGEEISRRVVERLKLDADPLSLSRSISAVVEPETVIMAISVTDPSPGQAQRLTQATAEEFVEYVAELETAPGKSTAPVKASIVDRATEPGGPVSPQPLRNLGLAVILGLLAGAGLAVLRDSMDSRVTSIEDLRRVTGDIPILGNIHFDKSAAKTPLISGLPPHAPRAEAFRVLRTNIQFINTDAESKVFVMTSANPGEGKSTTTCNLALSIADTGQSVVLVEGDLRRPKATLYFGLENSVGVTTVLIGRIQLGDAIQEVTDGCDLLASGATAPNPAELLQTEGMRRMLAALRAEYDVVLIDAPPLLPVTDAAILSSQADGAILVIHHGETTRDQVAACVERLSSVDARLVGTIVNMTPKPRKGFGNYGYGYGYGYGYAPEVPQPKVKPTGPKRRRGKSDPIPRPVPQNTRLSRPTPTSRSATDGPALGDRVPFSERSVPRSRPRPPDA